MPFETLRYEKQDGVAVLTLNRPDKMNTLSSAMRRELREVWTSINQEKDARVLVMTGAGDKAFCAGLDITERGTKGGAVSSDEVRQANLNPQLSLTSVLSRVEKPVIAAVNGVSAGGGLSLVTGSDIAIASENARFRVAHSRLGIAMMDGLSWTLPRVVGKSRAFEMYATNRIVDAQEAEHIGLVSKVIPHAELMPYVMELAKTLAKGPPLGMMLTKRAIERGSQQTVNEYLEYERLAYQLTYYSDDSKEALKAFLQKREPNFEGK